MANSYVLQEKELTVVSVHQASTLWILGYYPQKISTLPEQVFLSQDVFLLWIYFCVFGGRRVFGGSFVKTSQILVKQNVLFSREQLRNYMRNVRVVERSSLC